MYINDNGCRPHSLRAVKFGTCLLRQHTRLQKLDCTRSIHSVYCDYITGNKYNQLDETQQVIDKRIFQTAVT